MRLYKGINSFINLTIGIPCSLGTLVNPGNSLECKIDKNSHHLALDSITDKQIMKFQVVINAAKKNLKSKVKENQKKRTFKRVVRESFSSETAFEQASGRHAEASGATIQEDTREEEKAL